MTADIDTRRSAYRDVRESGEDVTLRRQVANALSAEPMTTHELAQQFDTHGKNAIRPRVNELIRMGCVRRDGTRTNPSGHEAYVNRLTALGRDYARGADDPEPDPPVAEHRRKVVDAARAYLRGDCDRDILALAVERHDSAKRRVDPEWSP